MLTPNQIKAAELLSQGYSHQEVADACKVSRRTILRWLNQNDFKNLSFGLIHRQRPAQQAPQPSPERGRQPSKLLTPEDLVQDTLLAIQSILIDPGSRKCDILKAAALVGEWSGMAYRGKTHEGEAFKVLLKAGWVPPGVLEILEDGWDDLQTKIKVALAHGQKKDPLQESEGGTFDINADEFDEFDDADDDDDE